MLDPQNLIRKAYVAFNERKTVEAPLLINDTVSWVKASEGSIASPSRAFSK